MLKTSRKSVPKMDLPPPPSLLYIFDTFQELGPQQIPLPDDVDDC